MSLMLARVAAAHRNSAPPSDPYWANVVSHMHFNGPNDSTTFTDQKGKLWTPGGGAKISTARSLFGGASGLFNGTTDYLDSETSADFTFGTGDFCIEFAVYLAAHKTQTLLDMRLGAYTMPIVIYTPNRTVGEYYFYNTDDRITFTLATGVFTRLALERVGGVTRLFKNGVQTGVSYTDGSNYDSKRIRLAGRYQGTADFQNGNVDEVRITKVAGRYGANYTPSAVAFPDG